MTTLLFGFGDGPLDEADHQGTRDPDGEEPILLSAGDELALGNIQGHLSGRTGWDFRVYGHLAVIRQARARARARGLSDLAAYHAFLYRDEAEARALADTLWARNAGFFRDPAQWQVLAERAIPDVLGRHGPGAAVRAWVVGCATGEDAYALMMLLLEAGAKPRVLASDLNESALSTARRGRYPQGAVAGLSAARLRRFFVGEDGQYRVGHAVRTRVLFARHDLMDDDIGNQRLIGIELCAPKLARKEIQVGDIARGLRQAENGPDHG